MHRRETFEGLFKISTHVNNHTYVDRSPQFQTGEAVNMGTKFMWSQITDQTKRIHIGLSEYMTIPTWERVLIQAPHLEVIQVIPALKYRIFDRMSEMCEENGKHIVIKIGKLDSLFR